MGFCGNVIFPSNVLLSRMQILSQANQSQSQAPSAASLTSSQIPPPPPTLPPPPALSPAQFILQSSLPLVGCTKTPPSHLHPTLGGGCAQTPPPVGLPGFTGGSGDTFWDNESKDPEKVKFKIICSCCVDVRYLNLTIMDC